MSLRLQYYSDEELGVFSLTEDIPFSHAGYFFSLTENTEVTEVFGAHFEPTERLRHTEFTERFS